MSGKTGIVELRRVRPPVAHRSGISIGSEQVFGSPSRTRTYDKAINSRLLYQLSYRGPRRGLYTRLTKDARAVRMFVGFVCGGAAHWALVAESPLRTGLGLCMRPVTPDRPPDPEAPFPLEKGCARGLVAEWLRRGLQILAPRFDSGRGLQLFPTVHEGRAPAKAGPPHSVASVQPNERVTALPQAA